MNLQVRFQKLTAVLLATEQLTGAVQPKPTSILLASGGASTGANVLEVQSKLDQAKAIEEAEKKKLGELEAAEKTAADAVTQAEKALSADSENAEKKAARDKAVTEQKAAQGKLEAQQGVHDGAVKNREALERALAAARSASVSTTSGGIAVVPSADVRTIDANVAKELGSTIGGMIAKVFDQDSLQQKCLDAALSGKLDQTGAALEDLSRRLDSQDTRKNFTPQATKEYAQRVVEQQTAAAKLCVDVLTSSLKDREKSG